MTNAAASISASGSSDDYRDFLHRFADDFTRRAMGVKALFTTDAADLDLWGHFLGGLPVGDRQHYSCHACRRFVEAYGGLVSIDVDGGLRSVMWGDAPPYFASSFALLEKAVRSARVTGVHVTDERTWGMPQNRGKEPGSSWHHMHVVPPAHLVRAPSRLKTAGQVAAEKREEYGMLQRGLAEYPADAVAQALSLIESEALYRNEKVIGPARWLSDLHAARAKVHGRQRDGLTWTAVATAPIGFCHVKSTMISTLLDDIVAGLPFEAIKRRFADKMHPLQYQRPQAAPSAGNIAQAEALVAKLGIAASLRRRYAKLEDVKAIWAPALATPASPAGSVFGHLSPKGTAPISPIVAKAPPMTWSRFERDVLPSAEKIEYFTDGRHFIGLVTAADLEAPPILQWDMLEQRNPVSWYLWAGGSSPSQWSLPTSAWVTVTAITMLPSSWNGGHEHHGDGAILLLSGARDTRAPSGCLFPEMLKSELREVRSTIEAYSKTVTIEGRDEATACGVDLRKGSTWAARVRVTSRGGASVTEYTLDRWE